MEYIFILERNTSTSDNSQQLLLLGGQEVPTFLSKAHFTTRLSLANYIGLINGYYSKGMELVLSSREKE